MKNIKNFIFEKLSDFDRYLNTIKGKEISFEEFKNGIKNSHKDYDFQNIDYSEEKNSLFVIYNLYKNDDNIYALDVTLEEDSTEESLIVKKWKYEEL